MWKTRDIAKKNLAAYYTVFAKYHNEWLKNLQEKFIKDGDFGIHQFILADRYDNTKDKEVATYVSLLVKATDTDGIVEQTDILYNIIGSSPFMFLMKKEFAFLSLPDISDEVLFSNVRNADLSILLSNIYTLWCFYGSIEKFYEKMRHGFDSMELLVGGLLADSQKTLKKMIKYPDYVIPLMFIRLMNKDGLGLGLWEGKRCNVCPYNNDVKEFVNSFFYYGSRRFTLDEKIALMGFGSGSDFYYAYLAYRRLMRLNPSACSRYATLFRKRLEERVDVEMYMAESMKDILPPIQ